MYIYKFKSLNKKNSWRRDCIYLISSRCLESRIERFSITQKHIHILYIYIYIYRYIYIYIYIYIHIYIYVYIYNLYTYPTCPSSSILSSTRSLSPSYERTQKLSRFTFVIYTDLHIYMQYVYVSIYIYTTLPAHHRAS